MPCTRELCVLVNNIVFSSSCHCSMFILKEMVPNFWLSLHKTMEKLLSQRLCLCVDKCLPLWVTHPWRVPTPHHLITQQNSCKQMNSIGIWIVVWSMFGECNCSRIKSDQMASCLKWNEPTTVKWGHSICC